MKKSIIFGSVILLIIIALIAVSIMRIEGVPIINVEAEVSVTDSKPVVTLVNMEQDTVNLLRAPRGDSNVDFPSVDTKALINYGLGGTSYWASNPYTGNGTYELVIGFRRGVTPKEGDMIKVVVSVLGERGGDPLATDTGIMMWE